MIITILYFGKWKGIIVVGIQFGIKTEIKEINTYSKTLNRSELEQQQAATELDDPQELLHLRRV